MLVANRVVSGQACTTDIYVITSLAKVSSTFSCDHLIPFGKELLLERQVFCDCLHDQVGRGKGIVGADFFKIT